MALSVTGPLRQVVAADGGDEGGIAERQQVGAFAVVRQSDETAVGVELPKPLIGPRGRDPRHAEQRSDVHEPRDRQADRDEIGEPHQTHAPLRMLNRALGFARSSGVPSVVS